MGACSHMESIWCGTHHTSTATSSNRMEEDWKERFTPLFVEFLGLHQAFATDLQAAGVDAALVSRHRRMTELLTQAERVLLERALRKVQQSKKQQVHRCTQTESSSTTTTAPSGKPSSQTQEQQRLQEYLDADAGDPFTDDLPDAFVESVRGWEIPGKEIGSSCSSSLATTPTSSSSPSVMSAAASVPTPEPTPPATPTPTPTPTPTWRPTPPRDFKSSLEMYDTLFENRRKKNLSMPWDQTHDNAVTGKRARKTLHNSWGFSVEYPPPSRPRAMLFHGREPEKVLASRMRSTVREYLIQWKNSKQATWMIKRRCPPAAKLLIDAFSKQQKNFMNRQKRSVFVVNRIVGHRMRGRKKEYLVNWEGYDSSDNTWEAEDHLRQDVDELVEAYESRLQTNSFQ